MTAEMARGLRPLAVAALAGFVVAFIAFAPASLAAYAVTRAAPLTTIAGAEGTLWRGRLIGYAHNGVLIGDIDYRLHALPLILGRLAIDARSARGALDGAARVEISPGAVYLKDVSATFNLGAIRNYTFFGVRYQGAATLTANRLRLTRTGCVAEAARIATSAFDALARRWSGGAFPMAGPVACQDGALVATLNGEGADGAAELRVSVRPDLSYSLAVDARPRRPDVSRALEFFGFQNAGDGLSYEAAGILKGLSS